MITQMMTMKIATTIAIMAKTDILTAMAPVMIRLLQADPAARTIITIIINLSPPFRAVRSTALPLPLAPLFGGA